MTRAARTIYLDLDGVFADFYGTAQRVLGRPFESLPPEQAWGQLDQVPQLFRDLPVLPGSLELLSALQHHSARLEVLSGLPRPTKELASAAQDKREWVARHLSAELKVNLIEGGVNKWTFARPGDVLIDDLLRNLGPWELAGGIGVHHTSVANTLEKLRQLGLVR